MVGRGVVDDDDGGPPYAEMAATGLGIHAAKVEKVGPRMGPQQNVKAVGFVLRSMVQYTSSPYDSLEQVEAITSGFTLLGPNSTMGFTLLGPRSTMGFTLLGPNKVVQHKEVSFPSREYPGSRRINLPMRMGVGAVCLSPLLRYCYIVFGILHVSFGIVIEVSHVFCSSHNDA